MVKEEFGKGTYFIGDICYALKDYIYNEIWGKQYSYENGVFYYRLKKFAVDSTAFGDGSYIGSDGTEYGVDAGVIGIVPQRMFKNSKPYGGRVVRVKQKLVFESKGDGIFKIQIDDEHLTINTRN